MTHAEKSAGAVGHGEIAVRYLHLGVRLAAQLAHGTGGSLGTRHGAGTLIMERE